MHQPHVARYWMQAWPRQRWVDEITEHLSGAHCRPLLVFLDGAPIGYVEVYRAALDRIASYVPIEPGDLGLHIAIGEPDLLGRGLGRRILRDLVDGLFASDERCGRVLAEPDETNLASLRAFAAAGFGDHGGVQLPEKSSRLLICPRREKETT